jgi:hypothetical protein
MNDFANLKSGFSTLGDPDSAAVTLSPRRVGWHRYLSLQQCYSCENRFQHDIGNNFNESNNEQPQLKAIYFPYTSPRSFDTILRGLLLYEKIGAITPHGFFLSEGKSDAKMGTVLERARRECEEYGNEDLIFTLDPTELIASHEGEFTRSVISDMSNSLFKAQAPTGKMLLYADKINRPIFEKFRSRIKEAQLSEGRTEYREGPYLGKEHFLWEVQEPLAHSILLNLTLLGAKKQELVPITDSLDSHRAFLSKVCGATNDYEVHVAAQDLMRLALPTRATLSIPRVLDFRRRYGHELQKFWRAMEEEQRKMADQFSLEGKFYSERRAEFENLRNTIKSSDQTLKWSLMVTLTQLVFGIAGHDPNTIVTSPLPTVASGAQSISMRMKTGGFGYLLKVEEQLAKRR